MIDVGVIGVGAMGKNHARVYSELKSVENLFIYDTDIKAAKEVAMKYNATVSKSLEEFIFCSDAISVCVPTRHHFDVCKEILKMHRDILIEKPICSTSREARELISQDYYANTIGVGHIERFNPVIAEIKNIVRKPLYIELKRHNPASARVTGSSVVEDLMIHDIDIVLNSIIRTPLPTEIYAVGNDDVCSVFMKSDHTPIVLSASRKSSKKIRTIYIEEEDFTVEGDLMSQEVTIYRKPDKFKLEANKYTQENIIEKVSVNKLEPLKVELTTFIDCVINDGIFPVTPNQAILNLEICELIRTKLMGG